MAEIPGSTHRVFPTRYDEEDYVDRGSAEREDEEEQSDMLVHKPGAFIPTLGPPALGTHHTYTENQAPIAPARAGGHRPSLSGSSNLQEGEVWVVGLVSLLIFVRVMDGV
jgi:hypothetical protein